MESVHINGDFNLSHKIHGNYWDISILWKRLSLNIFLTAWIFISLGILKQICSETWAASGGEVAKCDPC